MLRPLHVAGPGLERQIIEYTERVAGEIACRYADDPAGELELWLRLANQREAMVTQFYAQSGIEACMRSNCIRSNGIRSNGIRSNGIRSNDGAANDMREEGGPIRPLIGSVVLGIWAHEQSHMQFLSGIRGALGATRSRVRMEDGGADGWGVARAGAARARAAVARIQGQVEGWVTQRAVSGDRAARLLIGAGVVLGRAPEFAGDLRRMTLPELLGFSAALETTARMGYERILQLSSALDERGTVATDWGFSFQYDVARILCEERFHEAAFFEMMRWLEGSGESLSPVECTRTLHDLCARNLSRARVRQVSEGQGQLEIHAPEAGSDWESHGGLGGVFAAAGLPVPVREAVS